MRKNLAVVETEHAIPPAAHPDAAEPIQAPTAKAPRSVTALDVEESGPPPARIIKYSLGELLEQIPVGGSHSRVILGSSERGISKIATQLGLKIATSPEGEGIRVWVMSKAAQAATAAEATPADDGLPN